MTRQQLPCLQVECRPVFPADGNVGTPSIRLGEQGRSGSIGRGDTDIWYEIVLVAGVCAH